jgi:hypothetical protein
VSSSIASVGLITADRPAMVRRALASWTRHCDAHGRRPRFLIVDGSRTAANRRATRALAADVREATGRDVQYVGAEDAARFSAALRRKGAPIDLAPGSAGANRNLLLLLTAGERILSTDDDIVCDVWAPRGRRDRLALTAHEDLRRVAHFRTRQQALASVRRSAADLLAEHEALLGQTLPRLLSRSTTPPDLSRACPHILAFLRKRQRPIVAATFSGLAGDAATYGPERNREITCVAPLRIVTHDCHCMAGCMGLANDALLPPFPHMSANEDGVFGVMLAASDVTTLFGHVPAGVVHDSDRKPARATPRSRPASESRVSDLIINLLFRFEPALPRGSRRERLLAAGELLRGIGRLDLRAFVSVVTDVTLMARRGKAPSSFLPIEFHHRASLDAGYRAARRFIGAYGELVSAWPAAWETARELNGRA